MQWQCEQKSFGIAITSMCSDKASKDASEADNKCWMPDQSLHPLLVFLQLYHPDVRIRPCLLSSKKLICTQLSGFFWLFWDWGRGMLCEKERPRARSKRNKMISFPKFYFCSKTIIYEHLLWLTTSKGMQHSTKMTGYGEIICCTFSHMCHISPSLPAFSGKSYSSSKEC